MAVWVLFAAASVLFAVHSLPAVHGDATYFVPTAYFIRADGLWLSPVGRNLDPAGDPLEPARFVYHGWLYPYLIAELAPSATWPGIFVGRAIVASLAFGAILLTAAAQLRSVTAVLVMAIIAAATVTYSGGRPEVLAAPMLLIIASRTIRGCTSILIDGVILSLLVVAQPTICMTASIGYALYRLVMSPSLRTLASIAAVAAFAIGLALALFELIYPISLADWLQGIMNQMRLLGTRSEWRSIPNYYLTNTSFPLLGIPIAGAGAMLLLASYRQGHGLSRALGVAAAVLFLIITLFGALRVPATAYNVVPWLLVYSWFALARKTDGETRREWIVGAPFVALALSSVSVISKSTIQNLASALDERASFQAGEEVVGKLLENCHSLQVAFPVVPLLGKAAVSPRVSYEPLPPGGAPVTADAVVVAQYGSGSSVTPAIEGMALVFSSYDEPPTIAGLRAFNSPTSHNIAVLLRTNSSCYAGYSRSAGRSSRSSDRV